VGKDWNPVLLWREERQETAKIGPGVSRAREGERTKPYRLLVRTANAPAMTVTLQAATKRDAIRYGKARWPGAAVEVVK
jgi:hypothetical protein